MYVKRSTKRAHLMAREWSATNSDRRMTLRLERAEGAATSDHLFRISKLTAVGWVKGSTDYEDSAFAVQVPKELDQEWQRRQQSLDLRDLPPAPRKRPVKAMAAPIDSRNALPSLTF